MEGFEDLRVRSLLREAGACIKPWVMLWVDESSVVLYDYVRGVAASFSKELLQSEGGAAGLARSLLKLDLAVPGCGGIAFTDLVPGSPTTYALETGLGFYIERLDIAVPLGSNEPLNAEAIPYPCESYVTPEPGSIGAREAVKALIPLLERYVPVMKPASIVLSFGRLEGIVDDVLKVSEHVLWTARRSGAKLLICTHYGDYLRYWGRLEGVFSKAVVTYVSNGDVAEFTSALKALARPASAESVEKVVAYVPPDAAAGMINALTHLSKLRAVPLTFVIPKELGVDGVGQALIRFLMPPPLQNMPPIIHGLIAPCKYGSLCFSVLKGVLKAASCKWGHIHGDSVDALDGKGDISRDALKKALSGWREDMPCRVCGFRVICGFCRGFIRKGFKDGECPLRQVFSKVTRIPTE